MFWYQRDVEVIVAPKIQFIPHEGSRGPVKAPFLLQIQLRIARYFFDNLNERVMRKIEDYEERHG